MPNCEIGIRISARAIIVDNNHILLNECRSEPGLYYTLPGGSVNPGESAREALAREMQEEDGLAVEVGKLLLVYEYVPHGVSTFRAAECPRLSLAFACSILSGGDSDSTRQPDWDQIGQRWVPLGELARVTLLPNLADAILDALRGDLDDRFCQERLPPSWVTK